MNQTIAAVMSATISVLTFTLGCPWIIAEFFTRARSAFFGG